MTGGKSSTFVLVQKPKTGWREPSRAFDYLLELPNKRLLKPREELREAVPTETVSGGDVVMAGAKGEASVPAVGDTSVEKDGESGQGEQAQGAPYQRNSEPVFSTLDGSSEQTSGYNGDAEDEAPKQTATAQKFNVGVEGEGPTPEVGAEAELDDDELLAGEERETEGKEQDTSVPAREAGGSTGPYSSRTCIHKAKTLREGTETVHPHPTDAEKVIFTYQYTNAAGGVFVQETEIPEVMPAPANTSDEPGSIIVPDVETSKVPRTKKGSPWVPVPGTSRHEWVRGTGDQQETWRIVIFFRRLTRDTYAYQDIYINTNMLNNVDPNDKRFRTSYNKWILQFARRRDAMYTQKVARVHWSVAERRALYTAINTFCAKFGIHRFGFTEDCKLSTAQLQLMADAVNAAPNPLRVAPRGVDAVRGQIISAHDKAQPKNKAIFDLTARAIALRARLATGEAVSRAQRKPRLAIALAEFPVDAQVAAAAAPSTPSSRKRKRVAPVQDSDEEPSSSELSSPTASQVGGHDGVGEDTWMTTDEEIWSGESEEGNWSDTSEEVVSGEDEGQWAVKEVVSSPPAKKMRIA
ncbi:hypothetical protein EKO04_001440 [Ascochyta lentis]|uniref:Uncharacterized protein n=1 Tax=Ascochyta lentis TaxID=205686 RepID=A0A8H7JC44_9PLEO|nr:hypothetical protein EKO04_001440 [Ascochyta lentis]